MGFIFTNVGVLFILSRLSRAVKVLPVALKVSLPAPPVNAAPVSTPVVSEPVKVSQKSIVFNELRVVRGCLFGVTHRRPNFKKYALPGFAIGAVFAQVDGHSLTHCPPNPPMDGIVGGCGRGVFSGGSRNQIVTSFGRARWCFWVSVLFVSNPDRNFRATPLSEV